MSTRFNALFKEEIFSFQIVQRGLMTQAEYDEVSDKALRLFEFGQVSMLLLRLEKHYSCFFACLLVV